MKKAWNCLKKWNHEEHNPLGVGKFYPKSFGDMKKHLLILERSVIKFFLNFTFKLDKIYYLKYDMLLAAFPFSYIYFWCWYITLSAVPPPFFFFFFFLRHDNLSAVFPFFDAYHFISSFSFVWYIKVSE